MDSVSSDQAIIISHRHSPMHTYTMHHAYIVYHTIPILSPSFLYHPYITSFLIRRIFHLLVYLRVSRYMYVGISLFTEFEAKLNLNLAMDS